MGGRFVTWGRLVFRQRRDVSQSWVLKISRLLWRRRVYQRVTGGVALNPKLLKVPMFASSNISSLPRLVFLQTVARRHCVARFFTEHASTGAKKKQMLKAPTARRVAVPSRKAIFRSSTLLSLNEIPSAGFYCPLHILSMNSGSRDPKAA